MKYIYNDRQQLLSIAQKIDSSSYKIQWDRREKLDALLSNLASQLPKNSSIISQLREAIPDDFKAIFYPVLKVAC